MARLEDLQQGAHVRGLDRSGVATVEAVSWVGEQAVKVIFRTASGALKDRLVYRDDEPTLELAAPARQWSFDGDGDLLRLVSEANRIQLAWLFDPFVAVSGSLIRPLPHQISAVYEEMGPRQPLRFLLADNLGAGKPISAAVSWLPLSPTSGSTRCLVRRCRVARLPALAVAAWPSSSPTSTLSIRSVHDRIRRRLRSGSSLCHPRPTRKKGLVVAQIPWPVPLMTVERWVSLDEVANRPGVVTDSIYRWIDGRGLPAHRVGRLWNIKLSDVCRWIRVGRPAGGERRSDQTAKEA